MNKTSKYCIEVLETKNAINYYQQIKNEETKKNRKEK